MFNKVMQVYLVIVEEMVTLAVLASVEVQEILVFKVLQVHKEVLAVQELLQKILKTYVQ